MTQSTQGVETAITATTQVPGPIITAESQQKEPAVTTEQAKPTEQIPAEEKPKFAAIVKKEKQILREKQQLKAQMQAIEEKEKLLAEREAKAKQFEELSNPLDALKAKGWSYEDLTNYVLNDQNPTPEKLIGDVKKELESLKTQREQEKIQLAEQAKQAAQAEMQQIIDNFKSETSDFIEANKEPYELINLFDAKEVVFATVEEHFNKTQKVLSIKEACDLVEKYLEDESAKALQTKKLSAKYKPLDADKSKVDQATGAKVLEGSTKKRVPDYTSFTLNNSMTPTAGPSGTPAKSLDDRIKRALAVLDKRQA